MEYWINAVINYLLIVSTACGVLYRQRSRAHVNRLALRLHNIAPKITPGRQRRRYCYQQDGLIRSDAADSWRVAGHQRNWFFCLRLKCQASPMSKGDRDPVCGNSTKVNLAVARAHSRPFVMNDDYDKGHVGDRHCLQSPASRRCRQT